MLIVDGRVTYEVNFNPACLYKEEYCFLVRSFPCGIATSIIRSRSLPTSGSSSVSMRISKTKILESSLIAFRQFSRIFKALASSQSWIICLSKTVGKSGISKNSFLNFLKTTCSLKLVLQRQRQKYALKLLIL